MVGATAAALTLGTANYIESIVARLGWFGVPVYALLIFLCAFTPLPCFTVLLLLSGSLFGVTKGFLIVYPAAVLGSCVAFRVGRALPAQYLKRMPALLTELQGAVADGGFTMLLMIRLTPLPFLWSNLFLGSTAGVDFAQYAAATALGFLRLYLNVMLGANVTGLLKGTGDGDDRLQRLVHTFGVFAAMLVIGNVGRIMLRRAQRRSASLKTD